MTLDKLPVTVVTGFLGSGKTTLLRQLLGSSGRRLAVLINEFGDVGLDASLLNGCGLCPESGADNAVFTAAAGPPLVELANGCLCCTVQDEFLPVMESLLERRQQLDGVVIETSGLALPQPLVEAFQWPSIRTAATVDGVVTLVDGEALAGGHVVGDPEALERQRALDPQLEHTGELEDLFEDQLRCADLVLISRADRLDGEQLGRVQARIATSLRQGVMALPMAHGQVDPSLLTGLGQAAECSLQDRQGQHHHASDPVGHQSGAATRTNTPPGQGHDQGQGSWSGHPHSHAPIQSMALRLQGCWERQQLLHVLGEESRRQGLLRLKGRVPIRGKALPLQVQAVGPRLDAWFLPDSPGSEQLELVAIGLKPDRDAMLAALRSIRCG
ncbi:MAG: cobalamin biosynthesis protein CobW [Aphanocapsa feldmannii 277cV]|uniref:Cobalamin biosynthesis protein CobW n=2 Tax=Aphanocapsa feldmannii TaxID=192050 RepID=A0A524RNQ9_9CHRO|nr:MAG: cobalamin biosynthesis protein CobW [Aphanocapsa feldmannii 288cV]TGG92650.1 MAG: cobalamin biosynthesis protein CobW [Aphanocapsa feldmannii 277cV]TGH24574.1 MAG: cobalamin biosynthesis protein CobW [Aphanocapsa feldmannii 277cI]